MEMDQAERRGAAVALRFDVCDTLLSKSKELNMGRLFGEKIRHTHRPRAGSLSILPELIDHQNLVF